MPRKKMTAAQRRKKEATLHETLMATAKSRWPEVIKAIVDAAADDDRAAQKLLLDHLHRETLHAIPISTPLPRLPLSTPEAAMASQQLVVGKVAAGEMGIKEGKDLVGLIQQVIDSQAIRALEEFRAELDEIRRLAKGGERVINEPGEIVPAWGRSARLRKHDG